MIKKVKGEWRREEEEDPHGATRISGDGIDDLSGGETELIQVNGRWNEAAHQCQLILNRRARRWATTHLHWLKLTYIIQRGMTSKMFCILHYKYNESEEEDF